MWNIINKFYYQNEPIGYHDKEKSSGNNSSKKGSYLSNFNYYRNILPNESGLELLFQIGINQKAVVCLCQLICQQELLN
jgi:hypothetical protein